MRSLYILCLTIFLSLELFSQEVQPVTHQTFDVPTKSSNSKIIKDAVFDEFFLFLADDGIHGEELWRTDGTEEGTFMVKDIKEGEWGSQISFIEKAGNKIFFKAESDGVLGAELWVSDGTNTGTQLLKIMDPKTGFDVQNPCFVNEKIYFKLNHFSSSSLPGL